ncbi:MAG TPA: SLC13 family permease [Rhizobiaceae bacterium]|nr:SLC13 family permease [Rhizobiaceae bacterium]
MTTEQILSFAVIAGMMAAFIWGYFRYDLVAAGALLAALALGVVKFDDAFSGFSDDIVIIVGSALLVSAAVARSGIMERLVNRITPTVSSVRIELALLVGIVTILSAFVKNIGALAIMIPIAFQFAKRRNVSPSIFLMPMAFGALLGGLMTQIGTSPNIIVSRIREEMTGESFTMFDFTPMGAALSVVGLVFLVLFYWLVPERTRATGSVTEAIAIENYLAEAKVAAASSVKDKPIADLLKLAEGASKVTSILRKDAAGKELKIVPLPDVVMREGDIIILEGDPEALERIVDKGALSLTGDRDIEKAEGAKDVAAIEAVIVENSILIGLSANRLALFDRYGVNLLAVSRHGQRLEGRLKDVVMQLGDVIVLQGNRERMAEVLREFGTLPLAERPLMLGSVRKGVVPLTILLAAMAATAFGVVPVEVAFFAAAVLMVFFRAIPLRDVYGAIDGPILVMLAALIPVSDSLRQTGATDLISDWLADIATALPPAGALAIILVAAMAVTPFLNNAATVLVMAPIAAGFATSLGFKPEAFLMAVAIGAGCDFLTPIGHQCNTLVMGPGGYRFGDYSRLGAPLSLLVVLVSVPLLMIVWPLT